MTQRLAAILLLPAAVFAALPARGQVEISFPLGEHYRVGKYLPVRVAGAVSGTSPLQIAAPNAVSTSIDATNGRVDAVVPLLAIRGLEAPPLSVGDDVKPVSQSLQPLNDEQRLIGATSFDDALASELFPGKRLFTVRLDAVDPLPGPALAWGALDAVLLDPAAAARVTEAQLATLLACGTVVAVRADRRPAGEWPWERRGTWWIIRPAADAAIDVVQPGRYESPFSRDAGAPPQFRRSIVLGLSAFALLAVGASLWRARHGWVAVVVVSSVAAVLLALWHTRQPTATRTVIEERSGPWLDRYTSHAAFADGTIRQPFGESDAAVWPLFWSLKHGTTAGLRLECTADGTPRAFVAGLARGQSLVFLHRSRAPLTPTPAPATSPAAPPR